jgi:hypothetical protein
MPLVFFMEPKLYKVNSVNGQIRQDHVDNSFISWDNVINKYASVIPIDSHGENFTDLKMHVDRASPIVKEISAPVCAF